MRCPSPGKPPAEFYQFASTHTPPSLSSEARRCLAHRASLVPPSRAVPRYRIERNKLLRRQFVCAEQLGGANDNDDVSLLVPLLDVPVGLDDLLQWVASVDNRLELSRLHQFLEQRKIARRESRCSTVNRDVF